jgi:uncharacterized protein
MSANAGQGFVPGRQIIDAYGAGGFRFAGMSHVGSILATPQGVFAVAARDLSELRFEHFAPLIAELAQAPGSTELLVIGLGEKMARLPTPLTAKLRGAGLRLDAMATGPAARVYNVLVSENRRVAALLLAAP